MRKLLLLLLFSSLVLAGCGVETKAASGALALKKIGNFSSPLYVAQPPGSNKIYVVQQGGKIKVKTRKGWKTFLEIEGRVLSGGEQGLLSLAFSPRWQNNHLFYVYYTNSSGNQVVAEGKAGRYGRSGKIRRPVLVMEDFASNHNGGQLQFGPDGLLYIGTGDGGGAGDPNRTAQDTNSLLGKILSISPYKTATAPYTIPPDNPFVSGGGRGEIFSYGLRNPWRFSFGGGRIWIGDVGQDTWEEIDAVPLQVARGGNFGWSAFEGPDPYNGDQSAPGAISPAFYYNHDKGCSVTGGYLVGSSPPALSGRYIYGDYCSGQIRSFLLSGNTATGDRSTGLRVPMLSSFGKGQRGQIWVVSSAGAVYRIASN